jgi:hypothetical protein
VWSHESYVRVIAVCGTWSGPCHAHLCLPTWLFYIESVIAQFVLVPKGKAKGRQIGVTGGYPITVTLIRYLFLFRDDSPGETSPVTWGFEKAKVKVSIKGIPSHKSH